MGAPVEMVLPTLETLEGLALDALRTLGEYHCSPGFDAPNPSASVASQATTLRALGSLFEHRHGEGWEALIKRARAYVGSKLNDNTTADDLLYEQTLGLILALKRSPQNTRWAPPGLGHWMIGIALCLEDTFNLSSANNPPLPCSITSRTLSAHEHLLMMVAQHLAALEFEAQLPLGHWMGPGEMSKTAYTIRETIRLRCETQGRCQQAVWTKVKELLAKRLVPVAGRRDLIFVLSDWLQQALLLQEDQDDVLSAYAALALCLERLNDTVVWPRPLKTHRQFERTGWNRLELTWVN